ncbi:LuxR C-terminal-related transcriptional regulator [Vibrio sp. AK197]
MQPRLSLIHQLAAIKTPIVILNGLPGSGKSVVLKQLADYLGQELRTSLPQPEQHSLGCELFWDPVSGSFQQHFQQVIDQLPELEARGQTLYMTASWVGANQWLSSALLYQKVSIIEQHQLFMSEYEIQTWHPNQDATEIWLQTAGWPVLVANWNDIKAERFQDSWYDFVQTRILPQLPFHQQQLLVALAFCPTLNHNSINHQQLNIESVAPLIQLNSLGEMRLGVPYLRSVLQRIAGNELRLYQGAMRLVSKHHHLAGQRIEAIQTAVQSSNFDLAMRWFKDNGGGMYGYYHGYQELEQVLNLFPEMMLKQELQLAWAKMLALLKSHQSIEAQHFIESLPLDNPVWLDSPQQRGIVNLIKSKQKVYFSSTTEQLQVDRQQAIESSFADHHGALMSYYSSTSVSYSNQGEWFQAAVYQDKELALAKKYDIPYLIFYCYFNKARFDLRMGYPTKAHAHITQAERALNRVSYRRTLSYEHNFIDLANGLYLLMSGHIQPAILQWEKVATLRKHSEVWPDFLIQFHSFGLFTQLFEHSMDNAYQLLDELHYEFLVCFADDSGHTLFTLLRVLILQQQQRWVDGQKYLDKLTNHTMTSPQIITGNLQELYQWLTLRNQVGMLCIHQQKRAATITDNPLSSYPWIEIANQLQIIKLRWFKREYAQLQAPLQELIVRCYRLDLWFPALLESDWFHAATQWLWKKDKHRHVNTPLEAAVKAWQQRHQALNSNVEIEELSAKQLQIVQRLAEGLSNKQIAQYCGISESTVKFHLKNLFKQHQIKNRQALLALAKSKNWIK